MTTRTILATLALVCFLVSLSAVLSNQQRLREARTASAAVTQTPESSPLVEPEDRSNLVNQNVDPEILRLRAEVTRLSARKRELAVAVPSRGTLPPGVTITSTNIMPLPQGYLRRSKAQFAGYGTPESAVESLLWSIDKENAETFLQCFTDKIAEQIRNTMDAGATEFFKQAKVLPGILIQGKEQEKPDRVKVRFLVTPDMPSENLEMKLVGGEWKIDSRL